MQNEIKKLSSNQSISLKYCIAHLSSIFFFEVFPYDDCRRLSYMYYD